MSILNYYKRTKRDSASSLSTNLPDPEGPLSSSVPPGVIASAKKKVAEKLDEKPDDRKKPRGPYQTLTDAQKLMVARRAAEYGTTAAIRYFASEYRRKIELPPLKETTVCRLKDLYKEQLRVEGDIPSVEDFARFAPKKNGRPLKIGEDLDKQVREYITYLRFTGTSINTTVVIASAEGILMYEMQIYCQE